MTTPPPESITIDPAPSRWLALLRERPPLTPEHAQFRRELSLPTDSRLIMTGHQAEFWHVGILAKYFAADAAARAATAAHLHATPAWLIVDHDANQPGHLRMPVLNHDTAAEVDYLAESAITLGHTHAAGTPACEMPAISPSEEDLALATRDRMPLKSVQIGITTILTLLRRHASTASASNQHAHVLADLLGSFGLHAPIVQATTLSCTTLFRNLIARMAHDPESCVRAYNAAASAVPEAGLAPLVADAVQDRFELPLWHIRPHAPRVRVYAEDLPTIPPDRLAPRALFMTALLRLAGCDLFIHGLGGGIYDRATELWLSRWMPDVTLAPTAVVTATRYLRLPPAPQAEPMPRALWRLHHARHDPGMLGDPAAATEKRRLVERIAAAKTAKADPKPLYREMLLLLNRSRQAHTRELAHIAREAERSRVLMREAQLRYNRTWPFPLHDESTLHDLQRDIRSAFTS